MVTERTPWFQSEWDFSSGTDQGAIPGRDPAFPLFNDQFVLQSEITQELVKDPFLFLVQFEEIGSLLFSSIRLRCKKEKFRAFSGLFPRAQVEYGGELVCFLFFFQFRFFGTFIPGGLRSSVKTAGHLSQASKRNEKSYSEDEKFRAFHGFRVLVSLVPF